MYPRAQTTNLHIVSNPSPVSNAPYHKDYSQREPPPYPGHSRPLFQPGFRQSYSGSEASTDFSLSSSENLSVRQEPQGQETVGRVCGGPELRTHETGECWVQESDSHYKDLLKSTQTGNFYLSDSMSLPSTESSGGHDDHMVKTSHGNHVTSHDHPSYMFCNSNSNNNNVYTVGNEQKDGTSSSQQSAPPQYLGSEPPQYPGSEPPQYPGSEPPQYHGSEPPQYPEGLRSLGVRSPVVLPTSPSPSPTHILGLSKSTSPQKGPSPTPPAPPATSQPGHRTVPLMGCGAVAMTPAGQMTSLCSAESPVMAALGVSSSMPVRSAPSPALTSSQVTSVSAGRQTHTPQVTAASFQGNGLNRNSSNPNLVQLMTALSQHSTNHRHLAPSPRQRQRPSTAPSSRPQPLPPPPQYPGYGIISTPKPCTVPGEPPFDILDFPLAQSQPDLTHLSEEEAQRHILNSQCPQEHLLSPGGEQQDELRSEVTQTLATDDPCSSLMLNHYHQPKSSMSTSSSTSSLGHQHMTPTMLSMETNLMTSGQAQAVLASANGVDRLNGSQSLSLRKAPELDHAAIATRATQMVERLSEENRSLRQELEGYYKKVYRLQKVELDIQKVYENYETLVKHTQKQESLEKLIRFKLEAEIKKLRDTNKELKDQLDKAIRQLQQKEVYSMLDSDLQKELLGKDSLIAKLISQNRDFTAAKEQLEAELCMQKSTLQEQRSHLLILENALSSARSNLLRCEEEMQKRNAEEEKVSELQKALCHLQTAVERRELLEQQLRHKLEEEVKCLRSQQPSAGKMAEADEGIASDSESPTSLQSLIRQLDDKDQRIMALEAEVAKVTVIVVYLWKQKYLEETALRQFAVDAASMPKDARIAALEQSSLETEQTIAEVKNERLKHIEEVHSVNRRAAELEARLKTLQAELAEKEALVRVLQRHSSLSRASSITSLLGSPLHSPRPSFTPSPPVHSPRPSFVCTPSPLSSPFNSPLSSTNVSATPSGASSRQNSQLDTSPIYHTGSTDDGGNSPGGREGKSPVYYKSNSTGTSTTGNTHHGSLKEAQLRELQHKLVAQAALYGGGYHSGSDQLKRYMWQV